MKEVEDSVPVPIMEEAVKAMPALGLSHVHTVEPASNLPAGSGFNGDKEEEELGEEEESEEADEPGYGSSSPCSSSLCGSCSVRSPFSSDDSLSCDGHGCSIHCFSSFCISDGGYSCSSSSPACAYHKRTTSSCQTAEYASSDHRSILHSGHGSSIHGSDEGSFGLIDDGSRCGSSPYTYADIKQVVSSCQTAEYPSSDCHSNLYLSSETEKRMEHLSSCGFNDSYGCSTSSYHNSDEDDVVSSCCTAGCNSTYGHCSLCHSSEGETDINQPASFRFSDGCECSPLSHTYVHEGSTTSACHVASCSSTICYDVAYRSSEEGTCNIDAFEPHIQTISIRGNFTAQDLEDAKCKGLGSRQNASRKGKELSQMFQVAVDSLDWQVAEDLIPLADKQRLNDWLCVAVDSFWFLCTHKELCSATKIMEKLVKAGADGFTRAALRTSFLASCVWACQSRTRDLPDTVNILADRLHERLQECSGYEISSAEAVANVKQMAEWALKCILLHCQAETRGFDGEVCCSTQLGVQFQLRAFKRFLELAENRLSGEDYMEAFEAACFALSLFSNVLDSAWASDIAAGAMQGLLGMLMEGGADNVNQCCLEAARSGSTELLRMLLQIAERNGIEVDVDVALGYASHHCKLGTMECLVDVGNAVAFLDPLIRASDQGCMPVVQWFVEKGCQDMELCWGLTAAISSNRVEVAEYFIKCIPLPVLGALSLDIIKAAAERSGGCLKGIAFLFQHDFLCSPEATYEVADRISRLEDDSVSHELKLYCKDEWSSEAFVWGRKVGKDHYVNVRRVLHHGTSPLQLQELPPQLQVAIAYLPLYKECAASDGLLLSQCLRGQLIEAILRLAEDKHCSAERLMKCDKSELVAVLKARLPAFFVENY